MNTIILQEDQKKFVNRISFWAIFYTSFVIIPINIYLGIISIIVMLLLYASFSGIIYLDFIGTYGIIVFVLLISFFFGKRIIWKYHNWKSFEEYANYLNKAKIFSKILFILLIILFIGYIYLGIMFMKAWG